MAQLQTLTVAVCLFKDVTTLDYLGSMELFGFLQPKHRLNLSDKYALDITYVAHTKEIEPSSGPRVLVDLTVAEATEVARQFDILFVPGGTPVYILFESYLILD